ncbi:MAG: DUF3775 domain-containing protein [Rhodospirillaceae bacterium]|jgi:hypothetical protein|nr:DUF3775 domain-containing protein [Rhodospirillaceae bacterium]
MFEVDVDKVAFIIAKSREFEAQDAVHGEVGGDELSKDDIQDDGFQESLITSADEDSDDATLDEVKAWIRSINDDEQCQIVALAWVGRGDFTTSEWGEALKIATDEHNDRTAEYLLGMPLLPDYLEEGLSQLGLDKE